MSKTKRVIRTAILNYPIHHSLKTLCDGNYKAYSTSKRVNAASSREVSCAQVTPQTWSSI